MGSGHRVQRDGHLADGPQALNWSRSPSWLLDWQDWGIPGWLAFA